MSRKKWTVQDGADETVLKQREKRKWQIAFRRYIMLESPCSFYAPYFGLDAKTLRQWVELQFTAGQTWESFSSNWQFEHIVPVSVFDFENEADLRLCWNFMNIRVEPLENGKKTSPPPDLLSARQYFERLEKHTAHPYCQQILLRINTLSQEAQENTAGLEAFIVQRQDYINQLSSLGSYQFDQLNAGINLERVLLEMKQMGI
jgi:hypothetical protein